MLLVLVLLMVTPSGLHAKGSLKKYKQTIQTDNLNYTFTTERNYIRVRHEDGTVARYTNFKNNSALIEVG